MQALLWSRLNRKRCSLANVADGTSAVLYGHAAYVVCREKSRAPKTHTIRSNNRTIVGTHP